VEEQRSGCAQGEGSHVVAVQGPAESVGDDRTFGLALLWRVESSGVLLMVDVAE